MKDPVSRAKAWAAMQRLDVFTSGQVAMIAGASLQSTQLYLRRLMEADYLRIEQERSGGNPRIYRLVCNTGAIAPYLETVVRDPNMASQVEDKRQKVWNAVRMLKVFRMRDLRACEVRDRDIQRYLRRLERCGYISRSGFNKNYTFQLLRDTGVAAPIPTGREVFDPNEQRTYQEEKKNGGTNATVAGTQPAQELPRSGAGDLSPF